ncbi:MAG TPA: protein kinase [Thermoanaerobaculia bacterium]|nr:protein kinase [Thermoanaerobaculia bacterium]
MLPLTPTRLGRYEIVEEIGKGAMGVVYLARDPLIGRLVALKTFRLGYSVKDQEMEQFRVRFMREAQSAGILTHPNIVTIHDVVESSEEGLAFIAMEYVRGTNLKQVLQSGQPLSLDFVVEIVAQVGEALDYAHSNRVIHRDVKPANILITEDRRVKITDFGIARIDTSNLTQEGQLLGTPNYMAPEQIQGKEVDYRADLFSLGVVLYEMLTRRKPFQGENLTVVSHRIVYDPFTPPRDYVKELPPGMEGILERALEKDPARRYQRARDMVEDLRRVLTQRSVRGDDLNETQSLAQTMVLPAAALQPPPPPPPASVAPTPVPKRSFFDRFRGQPAPAAGPPPPPPQDSGTGAETVGTGTGAGLGTWAGNHATMASVPMPPPPPPPPMEASAATMVTQRRVPRPRASSVGRLLAAGLVALVVSILFWAGAFFWVRGSQPPVSPTTATVLDPAQVRFVRLMRQGEEAFRDKDYDGAIGLFSEAVNIAPADRKASAEQSLREAEREKAAEEERQEEIAAGIARAEKNLKDQRFADALLDVRAVLALDSANTRALELLEKTQAGLRRSPGLYPPPPPRENQREQAVASSTPQEQAPTPDETDAQPTASEKVSFTLDAQSEIPGVLIIRMNRQELLRHEFKRSGGLFNRRRAEPLVFNRGLKVLPGSYELAAQFWRSSGRPAPADVEEVSGNFSAGVPRTLYVRVAGSGEVTVSLE